MAKRYAVECDSPDQGRSTYPECWGASGSRGRVLSEHDDLADAVRACEGSPAPSSGAVTPWIFDRRTGKVVGASRIAKITQSAE